MCVFVCAARVDVWRVRCVRVVRVWGGCCCVAREAHLPLTAASILRKFAKDDSEFLDRSLRGAIVGGGLQPVTGGLKIF